MTEDAKLSDFVGGGEPAADATAKSSDAGDDGRDESPVEASSSATGAAGGSDRNDRDERDEPSDESDALESPPAEGDAATDDSRAVDATYAWGEYTCDRCDRTAERAWRDDGAFVCPDCKPW